jgi:ABC-type uncharacterized transport system substrate-binding protein
MSKAGTWQSKNAGQRDSTIGCRRWRPIWSAARFQFSPRTAASLPRSRPKQQPRPFRLSSSWALIRSKPVWSRASTRPEGNVTGVSFLINSLGTKRLELLSQMVPKVLTIGILANPTNPDAEIETRDAQAAAQVLGRKLIVVKASTENDFEAAFATLAEQGAGALAVAGDPYIEGHRDRLIALAARNRLPAIYVLRGDPVAGGLMSYGTSATDAARQGGVYVGAILKGAKPADLPVI